MTVYSAVYQLQQGGNKYCARMSPCPLASSGSEWLLYSANSVTQSITSLIRLMKAVLIHISYCLLYPTRGEDFFMYTGHTSIASVAQSLYTSRIDYFV